MNSCKEYFYRLMTDQESQRSDPPENLFLRFLKVVLSGLSMVYGFLVEQRAVFYKKRFFQGKRLARPVISVGNITWGGSGKTPLVELIVRFLQGKKVKPVVLIRGYMAEQRKSPDEKNLSDEARMLTQSLKNVPVLCGADRITNAQAALKKYPVDVFVLDDGFQYLKLERDLDIVAIDAANAFGNGKLIPRGILREPLSALRRADVFVLTKTDGGRSNLESIKKKLRQINPGAPVVETIHQAVGLTSLDDAADAKAPSFLKGKSIAALCGIAQPNSFWDLLRSLGADLQIMKSFQDHYVYERDDILHVLDLCREKKIDTLVTTDKDAVKLKKFQELFRNEFAVFSLKMKIQITTGEDELYGRISRLLDR